MWFWAGVRGSIRTDEAPASPSQLRPAVMPLNTWGHAHRPPPRPLIGPRVQTSGRPSGDWLKHRTSDFIKQIFWKLGKGYNRGKNPWDNCGTAQLAVLLPPSFPALRSLLLLLSPARRSVAGGFTSDFPSVCDSVSTDFFFFSFLLLLMVLLMTSVGPWCSEKVDFRPLRGRLKIKRKTRLYQLSVSDGEASLSSSLVKATDEILL